jgi:hypothetical protein
LRCCGYCDAIYELGGLENPNRIGQSKISSTVPTTTQAASESRPKGNPADDSSASGPYPTNSETPFENTEPKSTPIEDEDVGSEASYRATINPYYSKNYDDYDDETTSSSATDDDLDRVQSQQEETKEKENKEKKERKRAKRKKLKQKRKKVKRKKQLRKK